MSDSRPERLSDHTIERFTELTAVKQPTPGGGSVLAVTAGQAVALLQMVFAYSIGREAVAAFAADMREAASALDRLRRDGLGLADADAAAYAELNTLLKSQSEDQAAVGRAALSSAEVPIRLAELCQDALAIVSAHAGRTNPYLGSDLRIATDLLVSVCAATGRLVEANRGTLDRLGLWTDQADRAAAALKHAQEHAAALLA